MAVQKSKRIILSVVFSFCLLIFIFFILGIKAAKAADLYLSPSSGSYEVNKAFSVNIYVSTPTQSINAVSGSISFSQDKLEVTSLSKGGSMISLWVKEPSFSNSTGKISFEGIILNPGFTGKAGKMIAVNFKIKSEGKASLNFSSGSILANDGKGTNILTKMSGGSYSLEKTGESSSPPASTADTEKEKTSEVSSEAPPAPVISSSTHPDPEKWSSNNDPEFSWDVPEGVTAVKLLLDKKPQENPSVLYASPIREKKFEDLEDGIYYLHIRFKNQDSWGIVAHRKIMIDTKPPEHFTIQVDQGGDPTNPTPILHFQTTDSLSGVEYYEVKIGEGEKIPLALAMVEHYPFQLPLQAPGKHTVIVEAFDRAENAAVNTTEVEIEPLEPPMINDLPQTIRAGDILTLGGTSRYPDALVKVFVSEKGEEPAVQEVKTDREGNWYFVYDHKLESEIYQIWSELTDSRGAKSNPSEKITLPVTLPTFLRIGEITVNYLAVITCFIGLVVTLILFLIYTWRQISFWRKKISKESQEAEESVKIAFEILRQEVQGLVRRMNKKAKLNKREEKIQKDLQQALDISEKYISKEVKDIQRRLQ